jgi:hypothetical protein
MYAYALYKPIFLPKFNRISKQSIRYPMWHFVIICIFSACKYVLAPRQSSEMEDYPFSAKYHG